MTRGDLKKLADALDREADRERARNRCEYDRETSVITTAKIEVYEKIVEIIRRILPCE